MDKKYSRKEKIIYALKRAKGVPVRINLGRYFDFVSKVEANNYSGLSDEEISAAMDEKALPEVFALISEVIERKLGLKAYPEQLAAGKILLENKLIQMQTGEGKTLSAVFAAIVQVTRGHNVHILTANEYLAGRDCCWMGEIYRFFGITVSSIEEGMSPDEKRNNYNTDVVYLTAKQAGFDYLRDCLSIEEAAMQLEFDVCIIDEADFVMIDEARTPLVIARARSENYIDSVKADSIAKELKADEEYTIDRRGRKCVLNLEGIEKVCMKLDIDDSSIEGRIAISGINAALHARNLLQRDIDYIVTNDRIELIDACTGRKADKREWPYGIQRALEAKEGVSLKADGEICGSITIENFIKLYPFVSAMTATAVPAADEFSKAYNLETCIIPPHKPDCRVDYPDMVFKTKDAKFKALVELVKNSIRKQQPVLIGTASVRESEDVSRLLESNGITHNVLNAKQDAAEAELISKAGEAGAVTVATNMAGRGTDIILGGADGTDADLVREAGGLFIIGLNRYESLRVDNQLRGRAGRQGDPGGSRFLMSLEDELFLKYGIAEFLPDSVLDFKGDTPLENKRAAKEIARAQEIIEGQHSLMRRTLHNYSIVIEKYRLQLIRMKNEASENGLFPLELLDRIEYADEAVLSKLFIHELNEFWVHFLAYLDYVKEGIHLRRFGKLEPLSEFTSEASTAFYDGIMDVIDKTAKALEEYTGGEALLLKNQRSGSTWTYQIDDNPFPTFSLGLIGMDSAVGAVVAPFLVLFAPFFLVRFLAGKLKKRIKV